MTSDLRYNSKSHIIEIIHAGTLTAEDLAKNTSEALTLHKELDVDTVFIDTSKLESVENILDLYDLPKKYAEGGASRKVRIAIVMPETSEAREAIQFYDNVCNNRGWLVKSFETPDEAMEWLMANEFA